MSLPSHSAAKPPAYSPRRDNPQPFASTSTLPAVRPATDSDSDTHHDPDALPPPYRLSEASSVSSMRLKRDILCLFHDATARTDTYTADLDASGYYVLGPRACRFPEMRLHHNFDPSLRRIIWQPNKLHPGDVGYYDSRTGSFTTLFNAFNPIATATGILRQAQSLKFVLQGDLAQQVLDKRESLFNRILRRFSRAEYQNPYESQAFVFAEDSVFRSIVDRTSARMWLSLYIDEIISVYGQPCNIQREDIILVTGCLDTPRWAIIVSEPGEEGRVSLKVKQPAVPGEPWAQTRFEAHSQTRAGAGSVISDGSNTESTVLIAGLRMPGARMLATSI